MREILFRGFHKNENGKQKVFVNGEWIKGEWVYGYPVIDTGDCSLKAEGKCFCPHDGTSIFFWDDDFHEYTDCEIVPETVGQYTGLADKNGAKIFEGDIVKEYLECLKEIGFNSGFDFGKVFWYSKDVQFLRTSKVYINDAAILSDSHKYEVIGNIHDNPKLLDGVGNG